MAATTLETKEILILVSEDGKKWTQVAATDSDEEAYNEKQKLPEGVHMLTAYRFQLETKGPDGEN
jgi:hypothetical protein